MYIVHFDSLFVYPVVFVTQIGIGYRLSLFRSTAYPGTGTSTVLYCTVQAIQVYTVLVSDLGHRPSHPLHSKTTHKAVLGNSKSLIVSNHYNHEVYLGCSLTFYRLGVSIGHARELSGGRQLTTHGGIRRTNIHYGTNVMLLLLPAVVQQIFWIVSHKRGSFDDRSNLMVCRGVWLVRLSIGLKQRDTDSQH
jgi:hypothetical protein